MSSKRSEDARTGIDRIHLVDELNFLEAMRDTGYRNVAAAVAEFVDNSIEAGATSVAVEVTSSPDEKFPVEISVTDDGRGMSLNEMRCALVFGGSSRFGSRESFGRFGMGLPSASLSLARQVEVRSWRGASERRVGLSLDRRGGLDDGRVRTRRLRPGVTPTPTGTTVVLRSCDRHGYERVGWLVRSLGAELGRIFRRHIASGLRLSVDGRPVAAKEHLLLDAGAAHYGDTLQYKVAASAGSGRIRVQFSELPVIRWATLSPADKAARGVTGAKPISILRSGREIDRGWCFMGSKRYENYDAWWRCEIDFDPVLDELFGISYTKQGIRPTEELSHLLAPDLEAIARSLNSRIRRQFDLVKIADPILVAERVAKLTTPLLPQTLRAHGEGNCEIRLALRELSSAAAYEVQSESIARTVVLNAGHPLVRDLYAPLAASDSPASRTAAAKVALVALAGALTASQDWSCGEREQVWSDLVATFLERCS